MILRIFIFAVCVSLWACGDKGSSAPESVSSSSATTGSSTSLDSVKFVHAVGKTLVKNGEVIRLKGVNFNNGYYELDADLIYKIPHHREEDYSRVSAMGMNVIRFGISYLHLEETTPFEYSERGWAFLDSNITWAKKNQLMLILDMHSPQGGYQGGTAPTPVFDPSSSERKRLLALWKAIASRYRDESVFATFDLINEPTPKIRKDWVDLAEEIKDTIRSVDSNHLLIVERPYGWGLDHSLFLLDDENILYDHHFYSPMRLLAESYG